MEQVVNLVVSFLGQHLGVEVPVGLALCLAYLLTNDLLDVALTEKARRGRATLAELATAVANDVAQRNALTAAGVAVVAAIAAGGDVRAQIAAAVVAVAGANVANFEASTKQKLATLLL